MPLHQEEFSFVFSRLMLVEKDSKAQQTEKNHEYGNHTAPFQTESGHPDIIVKEILLCLARAHCHH
jgi:hypothetical protein